ncbi:hypothetical protein GCM10010112_28460 [Actinoplanes lobatus]|uniref:Uncharacterized protein n=1 Tax=Actinoplanes lobatus TaxID=113568 RepID=A0A7W7HPY1_9ACTN|nr:hypothetical protein [Actinoplanes lobatus]MBB4754556.1 hypothetical protein [Actinoplanes lobatus]GGN66255.1 hypothetical protein GCM10010112_28460 [Actinoplanes lobatus]GIE45909.1 hypothetical protein Alo02nite_88070 [Actinoplanes lobatus]
MLVVFAHSSTGSTVATVHRADGVVMQLPGHDRKYRVPHDLAHFATERALDISGGVFGSIAAGAVFANMRLAGGRPRHDASARSRRILDANKQTLGLAEVLAGVIHQVVETGDPAPVAPMIRNAYAVLDPGGFPWSDEQVGAAVRDLTELTAEWEAQGTLRVTWPDHLIAVPPPPRGVRRGRRGRT